MELKLMDLPILASILEAGIRQQFNIIFNLQRENKNIINYFVLKINNHQKKKIVSTLNFRFSNIY